MILSYLGSKTTILPLIYAIIKPLINEKTTFYDPFAGSGSVVNFFKSKVNRVCASDLELYAYVLNYALLKCRYTNKLKDVLTILNDIKGEDGLVSKYFSPKAGKLYFTESNARKIDSIRSRLNYMLKNNEINYDEFVFLLASLLQAASKYSNTCGTFRAHLKTLSKSASKHLVVSPIHTYYSLSNSSINKIKFGDAIQVTRNLHKFVHQMNDDITYLDPPYNTVHYGSYYSFLNYLCLYNDSTNLYGTGIIENYNKSEFGLKKTAQSKFLDLFDTIKTRYIIMSYSSKATLSLKTIMGMLQGRGALTVYYIQNKKLNSKDKITEYVFKLDTASMCTQVQHIHW